MGAGAKQYLPGLLMITAAVILLALVSFNVPLLKTVWFLRAKFLEYDLKLGTLGYCLEQNGNVNCTAPEVGYEFDLNKVMNLQSSPFNIPKAVSKYLTYVLVIHIVSLGFAILALILGVLELLPGCVVFCFPTCLAGIAGALALIVFIFDLAIFYIARSRINSVSGAHATIGAAMWMTLAAWLCCSFAGCAYGMGRACCWDTGRDRSHKKHHKKHHHSSSHHHDNDKEEERAAYRRDEAMRMQAIRDDMMRREQQMHQQQDLPNFQAYERQPLTTGFDDQYYYDEAGNNVAALPHETVHGVGVGYGRRTNANVARQPSVGSTFTYAGAAGLGAGGAGVEVPNRYEGYSAYQVPQTQQYASTNGYGTTRYEQATTYNDPYSYNGSGDQAYNYDNTTQGYGRAYTAEQDNPYARAATAAAAATAAGGTVAGSRALNASHTQDGRHNRTSFHSSDNYHDPQARVTAAEYDYADDGLQGIGHAATAPSDPRYRQPPPPPPPKTHQQRQQAHQSLDSQYTTYSTYTPVASTYGHPRQPTQPLRKSTRPSLNVPQPQPSGQYYAPERTASPVSDYPSDYPTDFSRDSDAVDEPRPPSYGHATHHQPAWVQPREKPRPM